jgi:hypothetical protein
MDQKANLSYQAIVFVLIGQQTKIYLSLDEGILVLTSVQNHAESDFFLPFENL